ncbi:lipoyl(octanoyl) transferase LipB [Thioalkalivibrio sp.]|uniref:lipoyl(octanoyl) transferase LipB n=1 Tax=Thioalkalivibrio sp. TaxID=2093813 RepID=UPI003565CEE7
MTCPPLRCYRLGRQPYVPVWRAMQLQLNERAQATPDELWRVEHPPVFTLGRNARPGHLRAPGAIPVIRVDRGGQVTFHGPGQIVLYTLLDLRRHRLGVRALVDLLQQVVIDSLAELGIPAEARSDAPGVYVDGAKIAALGLRVRHGFSMHGLSLNVGPGLAAFERIDACGYPGLAVTSMQCLGVQADPQRVAARLETRLAELLECPTEAAPVLPEPLVRVLART